MNLNSERRFAPFRRCAPDDQYATRQEAIVKEEYNRLPEAEKSPGKGMWSDLSQNEKFAYLLLDMRESRMKVHYLKQEVDAGRRCIDAIKRSRDPDPDSDSDADKGEDKGKDGGKDQGKDSDSGLSEDSNA